jgi:hypothetical protein
LRRIVGIVISENLWQIIALDAFGPRCFIFPKFNSNIPPNIRSLGAGDCAELISPKKKSGGGKKTALVVLVSRHELALLAVNAKDEALTFLSRAPLHAPLPNDWRFCPFFRAEEKKKEKKSGAEAAESVVLAYVDKKGHVLVDNCDMTESLRRLSVPVNDAVGHLSFAKNGSTELILSFRDLLGTVNVLRGNPEMTEKKFRLTRAGEDAAGDPVIYRVTFGFEVAWVGSDGALHRAAL